MIQILPIPTFDPNKKTTETMAKYTGKINTYATSRAQALISSQVAHGSLISIPAGRIGRGQHSIPTVSLLIHRNIMGQATQEVQLALDPPENLFRWHKYLEIPESDCIKVSTISGLTTKCTLK